uniref:Transcriptional regulator n=1 Tax=Macrostomum lignano TaxID=282301 RepID=A0A1I8G7D5_9PLAT
MQHCTKTPLLLANIRKYTNDSSAQEMLTDYLKRVEHSLRKFQQW